MSHDYPSLHDLLVTVREFLDGVRPALPAEQRFNGQVASYLLEICERELLLGAAADAAREERLAAFLGADAVPGDRTLLLAQAIRAGALDQRWDALLDLVLADVVDRLRIVRPTHLAPMHRAEPRRE